MHVTKSVIIDHCFSGNTVLVIVILRIGIYAQIS